MENASKALIMAGGVLIALLVIGALILMLNNLSSYQEAGIQNTKEAQVIEFNNQYETYNRKNVRGSDIVSLINRIIDYNNRKSQEGYQQMNIKVTLSQLSKFAYNPTDIKLIKSVYTQNNLTDLVGILNNTNTPKGLENKYEEKYIRQLSAEISQVFDINKGVENTKKLLPKDISYYGGIDQIKKDASVYYEYSQFKRAYFDCTKVDYNNVGRVINMEFVFTGKFN